MENNLPHINPTHKVCIVGCGFAGICAATRLCRDLSFNNFVMFDMNPEIGGTWYANSYPGSSCDGPIHLYTYSFEPKPDWKNRYATQPEIQEYLKGICTKYKLCNKIRLKHQVLEIRFDKVNKLWNVSYKNLENQQEHQEDFNIVILGTGILRNPKVPQEFKTFEGTMFHTAKWDNNCTIRDKVVAVVGVGSSGIQVIPELAKTAKKLIVYQRRASWVLPKENKQYSTLAKFGFKFFPSVQWIYRMSWYNYFEKFWFALRPGRDAETLIEVANKFREIELRDFPQLLKQQKPKDSFGCQRVLFSSDYFATLKKPNVKLITFERLVVKKNSLIADGKREEKVDVVILATGFKTEEYFSPIIIWDAEGGNVLQQWNDDGPSLLFGITGHKLPNLFFLWGPNTVQNIFIRFNLYLKFRLLIYHVLVHDREWMTLICFIGIFI